MMKFKFLEHTADIKFQAFGKSLSEMFENSALALFNVFCEDEIKELKTYKIKTKAEDLESLMYNFLEEFLVLFESENFLPGSIKKIKLNEKDFSIDAEVVGDNSEDYDINNHVKAITYNQMFIKKQGAEWVGQVVLDV